jgi:aryl-alcohol dehydrogenase-like predicted oxidoreductase
VPDHWTAGRRRQQELGVLLGIAGAVSILREAVAAGVNHIDTSDFYGPHVTNQIIRRALHPYPDDLVIATKISARRGEDGSWIPAFSPEELTRAVHDNLRNLGRDVLDVVNLRSMQGIPDVPFFPLGGFTPLQSSTLSDVACRLKSTPMQVALAWLLHLSPNILLIPGTSSLAHLRENLAAGQLTLTQQILADLDGIARAASEGD